MPKGIDGSTMLTMSSTEPFGSEPQDELLSRMSNSEMNRRMDLSIIVVNFNTGKFLEKCLVSVINACKNLVCEILVVDNSSHDGSEQVAKKFGGVTLIKNKENLGFAKANNIALRQIFGKYVLLLNPDTQVGQGTFVKMIEFMDRYPEAGAATCKVVLPNGEVDWASHRGFPTPWNSFAYFVRLSKLFPKLKFFAGYHQTYKNLGKTHEIDSPSGTFYMVRKEVIDRVGLLDEDYFMYGEDLDWSYRIKQAGYKIFYVPQTKILHYKGIASGIKEHTIKISQAAQSTRLKAAQSFYETMKIFYNKHYQNKYPKFIKWLTFLGINLLKNRRLAKLQGITP